MDDYYSHVHLKIPVVDLIQIFNNQYYNKVKSLRHDMLQLVLLKLQFRLVSLLEKCYIFVSCCLGVSTSL